MKLIALDLDGTLLNEDKSITESNLYTIQKQQEQGRIFMLASAKNYANVKAYADFFKIDNYSAFNGAINVINGKITSRTLYTYDQFLAVRKWLASSLKKENVSNDDLLGYFHVHCLDDSYYVLFNEASSVTRHNKLVQITPDFFNTHEVYAISAFISSKKQLEDFYYKDYEIKNEFCNEDFPLLIATKKLNRGNFNDHNYSVLFTYSNKLKAVQETAQYYNVQDDDVVFIGDDSNDKQVISYYKNSLIMKNASKELDGINRQRVVSVDYALNKKPLDTQIVLNRNKTTYILDNLVISYQASLAKNLLLNRINRIILPSSSPFFASGYYDDKNAGLINCASYLFDLQNYDGSGYYQLKEMNAFNFETMHPVPLINDDEQYIGSAGYVFNYNNNLILYLPQGKRLDDVPVAYFTYKTLAGRTKYILLTFSELKKQASRNNLGWLNKVAYFDYYFLGCSYDKNYADNNGQENSKNYTSELLSVNEDDELIKFVNEYEKYGFKQFKNPSQFYLMYINSNNLDLAKWNKIFSTYENVDIYLTKNKVLKKDEQIAEDNRINAKFGIGKK